MTKTTAAIAAYELQTQVCEALGLIPMTVQRIIIDLDAKNQSKPVPIYVQMVGDKGLLSLDWSKGLEGAEVVREPKGETEP